MAENMGSVYSDIRINIQTLFRDLRQVRDEFRETATNVNRSTQDISRSFADTSREVSNDVRDTSRDVNDSGTDMSQSMSENASNIRGSMVAVGSIITGVGVAIIGTLAKATMAYEKQAKVMRKFEAQTKLSGKELESFQKAIKNTYLDGYGEDLAEVSNEFSNFQRELKLSASETKKLVDGSFVLRNLYEIDMQDSLKGTSSLIKNFGIDGQKALDIITTSTQQAGDRAGDLLDTFDEYSVQFASMGYSAEEFAGILVKGLQDGAFNADKLGDGFKEFNIRIQDGSKATNETLLELLGSTEKMDTLLKGLSDGSITTKEAMGQLAQELLNVDDKTKQNQLGVALYGSMWEDLGGEMLLALTSGESKLKDFNNSNKKATKTLKGEMVTMEQVNRQFEELLVLLGETFAPVLSEIAKLVKTVITELRKFSESNPELFKIISILGAVVGVLATIVGPILVIIGLIPAITAGFGMVAGVISTVATAIGGAVSAIVAFIGLPAIVVAAIIAAIVALGIIIYKNWDAIKTTTINIWNSIVYFFTNLDTVFADIWNTIKNTTLGIWEGLLDFFKSIPDFLKTFILEKLPLFIGQFIGFFIKLHVDLIKLLIKLFTHDIPNILIKFINSAINFIKNLVVNLVNAFINLRKKVIDTIISLVNSVISWLKKLPQNALTVAKNIKDSIINGIKDLPNLMKDIITNAISSLGNLARNAYNSAKRFAGNLWEGFKKGLGISSPSFIEEAMFSIVEANDDMVKTLKSNFSNLSSMPGMSIFKESANKNNSLLGNTTSSINNFESLIAFNAPVNIRNDNDLNELKKLSQGLYDRIQTQARAKGIIAK